MRRWFESLRGSSRTRSPKRSRSLRLQLEELEGRIVPSTTFTQTNLVSDQPGVAPITDPNLVNAWGIAIGPVTAWVSANGSDVSTVYAGQVSNFHNTGLVVSIPGGAPTGQVSNPTKDFVVNDGNGHSGPAAFIFASENGTISGWNPRVPPPPPSTQAQLGTSVDTAVFKGIALANNGSGNFLYATDFHNNQIDVFDSQFHLTTLDGNFRDPSLPKGYAPFGIAAINNKLFVTYAMQDSDAHDDVPGVSHGFIDVFDTNGHMLQRFAQHGPLDSPWGLALAPSNFGDFSNDLLVGNFGNGRILAYNPTSGEFQGFLHSNAGPPLAIDGLWGLAFGNGTTVGQTNQLFFSAGPDHEGHGLFGVLDAVSGSSGDVARSMTAAISAKAPTGTLTHGPANAAGSTTAGITTSDLGTQLGTLTQTTTTPPPPAVAAVDRFFIAIGKGTDLGSFIAHKPKAQSAAAFDDLDSFSTNL
jgi:uncharacterized protein (TIGR03118 family)